MSPEVSHKHDQRSGAPPLSGQTERVGVVQHVEDKAPGTPYSSLPVLKGGLRERWGGTLYRGCRDRMRGSSFKLKEGRFRLDVRKKFFTVVW